MNHSTCYHCHENPPNRHSVFCDACLADYRPLIYPTDRKQQTPLFTRILWLAAFVVLVWIITETLKTVWP